MIIVYGCVIVGIAFFFRNEGTYLNFSLAFFVLSIAGISSITMSEFLWLRALQLAPIVVAYMVVFSFPALLMVWVYRRVFPANEKSGVVVAVWLICYMWLLLVGPEVKL